MALNPATQSKMAALIATKPRIILGSASSSRRLIMDDLCKKLPGLAYEVRTADIDEKAIRHTEPSTLVMALAHAKADAIVANLAATEPSTCRHGYLLTCDQVVVWEGQIREKPESREEAAAFIDSYSQAPASTVGSVLWTDLASGEHYGAVDVSYIHMDPLPASARDQLIAEGEVFHCAGGLMMEHPLVAPLITRIEGSEDGVRGLAQGLVVALLLQAAKL